MALLHRPELKELMALSQLMKHSNASALTDLLKGELQCSQARLVECPEDEWRQLQGRAKLAKALIQLLEDQSHKSY